MSAGRGRSGEQNGGADHKLPDSRADGRPHAGEQTLADKLADNLARHEAYYQGVRSREDAGRINAPGNQYLVHLLRGGHLGADFAEGRGRAALDVGCGSGWDLAGLGMMGWRPHGVELTEAIARRAEANARAYGQEALVRVGTAQRIPYPDGMFALALAGGVLHYAAHMDQARLALAEMARVLAPGGRVVLTTNHPENWIMRGCERLGDGVVRVNRPGDHRHGQLHVLFERAEDLARALSEHFTGVQVGENRLEFFDKTVRNWVATGVVAEGEGES